MSTGPRDLQFTKFLIETDETQRLNLKLDPTKGSCRMAMLKDGRYVQCMQQTHVTPDCDLKVSLDDLHLAATNIEAEDLLDLWTELEAYAPADSGAPSGWAIDWDAAATVACVALLLGVLLNIRLQFPNLFVTSTAAPKAALMYSWVVAADAMTPVPVAIPSPDVHSSLLLVVLILHVVVTLIAALSVWWCTRNTCENRHVTASTQTDRLLPSPPQWNEEEKQDERVEQLPSLSLHGTSLPPLPRPVLNNLATWYCSHCSQVLEVSLHECHNPY